MAKKRFDSAHVIAFAGVWSVLSTVAVAAIVIIGGKPVARAVILMGLGLVLLWVAMGGLLTWRFRDRVRSLAASIPGPWQVKFVLFCTLLAMTEEAITTSMTNLAPVFGVPVGKAYITASANYLDVICFHSVVVFIPMFVGWAWMLSRWDFHPNAVFLLYGLTGTLSEVSFGGPQHFAEIGMWTCVYGLMVYLPAYCIPHDRPVRPPRWWQYILAVYIPVFFAIPVIVPLHFIYPISIHFPPIQSG